MPLNWENVTTSTNSSTTSLNHHCSLVPALPPHHKACSLATSCSEHGTLLPHQLFMVATSLFELVQLSKCFSSNQAWLIQVFDRDKRGAAISCVVLLMSPWTRESLCVGFPPHMLFMDLLRTESLQLLWNKDFFFLWFFLSFDSLSFFGFFMSCLVLASWIHSPATSPPWPFTCNPC